MSKEEEGGSVFCLDSEERESLSCIDSAEILVTLLSGFQRRNEVHSLEQYIVKEEWWKCRHNCPRIETCLPLTPQYSIDSL